MRFATYIVQVPLLFIKQRTGDHRRSRCYLFPSHPLPPFPQIQYVHIITLPTKPNSRSIHTHWLWRYFVQPSLSFRDHTMLQHVPYACLTLLLQQEVTSTHSMLSMWPSFCQQLLFSDTRLSESTVSRFVNMFKIGQRVSNNYYYRSSRNSCVDLNTKRNTCVTADRM